MVLSHLYPVVEIVFFTWKVLLSFLSVKIGLESLRKSCLWKEKGHLPLREKERKGEEVKQHVTKVKRRVEGPHLQTFSSTRARRESVRQGLPSVCTCSSTRITLRWMSQGDDKDDVKVGKAAVRCRVPFRWIYLFLENFYSYFKTQLKMFPSLNPPGGN